MTFPVYAMDYELGARATLELEWEQDNPADAIADRVLATEVLTPCELNECNCAWTERFDA